MSIRQVTLQTISEQLRARWESVPYWTPEEASFAFNEALRTWNMLTGTWKRKVVFGIPAYEHWISVPGTILYSTRVSYLERPLDLSSIFDLDNGRQDWESEFTSSGGRVPTTPRKWAPAGLDLMVIWPALHFCATLTVDGVADTPQLVLDTDFVDLENSEHSALLGFALHVAAFKEGGTRWETTFRYHKEFLLAAGDRNARMKSSKFFRRYMGLDFARDQHKMREPQVAQIAQGVSG